MHARSSGETRRWPAYGLVCAAAMTTMCGGVAANLRGRAVPVSSILITFIIIVHRATSVPGPNSVRAGQAQN